MKCDSRQLAILNFIESLPEAEHEWQEIAVSYNKGVVDRTSFICKYCSKIKTET